MTVFRAIQFCSTILSRLCSHVIDNERMRTYLGAYTLVFKTRLKGVFRCQ
jgi:hypothetical protein